MNGLLPIQLTPGERILIVRRRLGLSQPELGKLLRVHQRTISRAERLGRGDWKKMMPRWAVVESRYRDQIMAGNGKRNGTGVGAGRQV